MPKTFIFGADSFIGNAFYKSHVKKTLGTSRRLDQTEFLYYDLKHSTLTDLDIDWSNYEQALICFGNTKLAFCEMNQEESYALNVSSILSLVQELHERGIKPIVFSSDLVFDGTLESYDENSEPSPLNEYGRQKSILEREVRRICKDEVLIFRLSKVYDSSPNRPSFLFDIINQFKNAKEVLAATDYYFCPIALGDVIEIIKQLQIQNETGLFNLAGQKMISWFELCQLIAKTFNFPISQIKPVQLSEINPHIQRPSKVRLLSTRLKSTLPGFEFRSLMDQLNQIKELNLVETSK